MEQKITECVNKNASEKYILPFFWQHGEELELLKEEIDAIQKCGINEMCIESRTHEQFGEDKWWDDFKFILDYAKKHDMKVWLLDDKHFPTGYANGYIDKHPEHRQLTVYEVHRDICGGNGPIMIQAPWISSEESFVAFGDSRDDGR